MARENSYTPLYSEILSKLGKIKSKKDKVNHLKHHNDSSLRMVIKSSFDPKIKWSLPEGEVPYRKNDAPEGTEHSNLAYEARKLFHYIEGGNPKLTQNKRESMFIQLLEALHPDEADILIAAIGKPNFVTPDMVKNNAVVIDVGINRLDGKLVGDVDFASVSKQASLITPVPGGVGPMTIAMLMENTLQAFKNSL